MKSFILLSIFSLLSIGNLKAQAPSSELDSVETFEQWEDLFLYETYYISGQPKLKELEWLKEQGITKIINLRTKDENKDFSKESFNEKKAAKKLEIEYITLPISGISGYTSENLALFMDLVDPDEKILIHCKSGGRATTLFMAYLVKEVGYTVDRTVNIGKKIKFSIPLEDLLGVEIRMEIVE